jgi:hypothetical protein
VPERNHDGTGHFFHCRGLGKHSERAGGRRHVPAREQRWRAVAVLIGIALTIGLFIRAP